jgi:predicted aspartyl protease
MNKEQVLKDFFGVEEGEQHLFKVVDTSFNNEVIIEQEHFLKNYDLIMKNLKAIIARNCYKIVNCEKIQNVTTIYIK